MGGWVCWCAWVSRRIYCVTKTIFRANWWCFQRNSVGSNLVGRFCFNVLVLLFWFALLVLGGVSVWVGELLAEWVGGLVLGVSELVGETVGGRMWVGG